MSFALLMKEQKGHLSNSLVMIRNAHFLHFHQASSGRSSSSTSNVSWQTHKQKTVPKPLHKHSGNCHLCFLPTAPLDPLCLWKFPSTESSRCCQSAGKAVSTVAKHHGPLVLSSTSSWQPHKGTFQLGVLQIYLNKSVEDLEDLFLDENREDAGVSQHLTNELLNPRQEDVHGCQQWFSFVRLPVPSVHGAKRSKSIFKAATQSWVHWLLKDKGALITKEVQVSNKSPFLEANTTESSAAGVALFLPSHHK